MHTYCTIINSGYIAFAKVLWQSLRTNSPSARLQVLITDLSSPDEAEKFNIDNSFTCHAVQSLTESPVALEIYKKYSGTNNDSFRWALKPVFITCLLKNGYEKVIYLDADLYFTGNPDFLFRELDTASVLLTPHWSNTNPFVFEDGLFSMLRGGIFNAGFIGASADGLAAMEWWAGLCHYRIEKVPELGLNDDQKYLDLLPVEFEKVCIVRHRGCNLASWNIDTNVRGIQNGKLMINGKFEPVFIHFTRETIHHIRNGNDALLKPYLIQYLEQLRDHEWSAENLPEKNSFLYTIKQKTQIRTRIKRLLFRLAQKI
jgi:hypothetical protein